MIPPEFDYVRVGSVDEALSALRDGGEDAKVLAGGHSLLPLMKLRLAAPTLLVDLGGVPGLSRIERSNGGWRIGAMTPMRVWQAIQAAGNGGRPSAGPRATEQGREVEDHGEGSAGSGPTSPSEGGAA